MRRIKIITLLFLTVFLSGCGGKPTVTLFKGSWESIWHHGHFGENLQCKPPVLDHP